MLIRIALCSAMAALAASGQLLDNHSLSGKYLFRHVSLAADSGEARSVSGVMTFDGSGGMSFTGTQIIASGAPASTSGSGTYRVQSSGLATLSSPLRNGFVVNARVSGNAVVGSSTEAGVNYFDMFIAVKAPATGSVALNGTYSVATLEFPNGNLSLAREAFFRMTANGPGTLAPLTVQGQGVNLGNRLLTQMIPGVTYSNSAGDGSSTLTFPVAGGGDPNSQIVAETKSLYVAPDGSFFIGGGTSAGAHGFLLGVRTGASLGNANFSGLYWGAGLRTESGQYSSFAGSSNALGDGRVVASERLRSSDGVVDLTALRDFTVSADGSGTLLGNDFALAGNGQAFVSSGLSVTDTTDYELQFGIRAPAVSGTGLFLNPQGVFNVFSFAPAGTPVAPGEFITIYGSGLPARGAFNVPFPPNPNGERLLINNVPAPIYYSTPTQVFAVVPYSVSGTSVQIVLDVNGTRSNTVELPLAPTAPGVAAAAQNGLGPAAVTHADGSVVDSSNPAHRGETITIYCAGLGAVLPAVNEGTAAPSQPLAQVTQPIGVFISGSQANVQFQGLTPGYAGLYQINAVVPVSIQTGTVPLAVQTSNAFTDQVDLVVAP